VVKKNGENSAETGVAGRAGSARNSRNAKNAGSNATNESLYETGPIGIIDIGSNSVRLVVFEGPNRCPTPLFNEKVLCGLGRSLVNDGVLGQVAVDRALRALRRFRIIASHLNVGKIHVVATAAARDASDGPKFIRDAKKICASPIKVLSGEEEAALAASGIYAGFNNPKGVAGDMGGGSLELIGIEDEENPQWVTLGLGGLRLMELSDGDLGKARSIARRELKKVKWLKEYSGLPFYAVGGTWRAFAKIHMAWRDYPLRILHSYQIPAGKAIELANTVQERPIEFFDGIDGISSVRRQLLPFGAVVLEELIRALAPSDIIISAYGIREGLQYEKLPKSIRKLDPLIAVCEDLARLRSRSLKHAFELCKWTDQIFNELEETESDEEIRLRHATCLVSDVGWRVHPDYRGEQSINIIDNAAFAGIDHPGRAFIALTLFLRHEGLKKKQTVTQLRGLMSERAYQRAKILAAALRAAHMISVGRSGALNKTKLDFTDTKFILKLFGEQVDLNGERLEKRFRSLATQLDRKLEIAISTKKTGTKQTANLGD